MIFDPALRRQKSAAFTLERSSAGRLVTLDLWGRRAQVYANANLSIYSAQRCNARCPFCVEELRPASRGRALSAQRTVEENDERYFAALAEVLDAVAPLSPTVSITGGEPSKDRRLPRLLRALAARDARKRTVTTNGSGLLDEHEGRPLVDWIRDRGVAHLNISRAHPDHDRNAKLMGYDEGLSLPSLAEAIRRAAPTRVRLSCVLLRGAIDSLDGVRRYLDFARSVGVDNVIFRQLMRTDGDTVVPSSEVVRFSDRRRALLEPLLESLATDREFELVRQIVGYYYYVEVWRWRGVDVVFEEADLAQLEREKRARPEIIHELIFHPDGKLASTWQPWDGVLGPP